MHKKLLGITPIFDMEKKIPGNTRWPNQLTINILNPNQLKSWNALHSSSYKHFIIPSF